MSVVTNAILAFSIMEDEDKKYKEVNAYFEDSKGFVSCDDKDLPSGWYGGNKMLETNVAIGSFNHFSIENFMNHLAKIHWKEPENVQLIAQEQEENKFKIISL